MVFKLKGIGVEHIDKVTVISLLSQIVHVRRLKPSTISHYRSAPPSPLSEYFKEDLNCPKIQFLLTGMKIRRTHEPSPKTSMELKQDINTLREHY